MEEDVLILLGVAFNLNLPLPQPGCSTTGWATRRGYPIRWWLLAKPSLSVSTG